MRHLAGEEGWAIPQAGHSMAKGSKRTIIGCSGLPSGHVKMSLSRAIRKGQGQEFLATVLRFVDYSNRVI